MNAFTTHEATAFYVKVLDQQVGAAFDLLADLFHHSRFGTRDLEKEKQIVIEEIRTVQDDPEDYLHELHARDVLGQSSDWASYFRDTTINEADESPYPYSSYKHKHYRPENTIVAVAGNFSFPQLLEQANEYFGQWQGEGTDKPDLKKIQVMAGLRMRVSTPQFSFKAIRASASLRGFPGARSRSCRSLCGLCDEYDFRWWCEFAVVPGNP